MSWKISVPLVIKLQINASYHRGSLPIFIIEIDAKFQLEMNPNEDIIIFPSYRFPKFSLQSPPLSLRGKSWALGSVFVLSSAVSASYDFGHVT